MAAPAGTAAPRILNADDAGAAQLVANLQDSSIRSRETGQPATLAVRRVLLDDIDAHLGTHRYLVGDRPTEADWCLFPTLIRFEWVYHGLFKCNWKRLVDYPNLYAYARELDQWPGIAPTIDERKTRDGYYGSMRRLNPTASCRPGR